MADRNVPKRLKELTTKSWSQESGEKLGKIVEKSKEQRQLAAESPEARADRIRKKVEKDRDRDMARREQGDAFDAKAWEEMYARTHG